MNSRSAYQVRAIVCMRDWTGPTSTEDRNPFVGEPPLTQDLADVVE